MNKRLLLVLLAALSSVTVVSAETVWVANHDADSISIIDPETDTVIATYVGNCAFYEHSCITEPTDVTFSPDGSIAYVVANSRGVVVMLDTAGAIAEDDPDEVFLGEFDLFGDSQAIVASPDGDFVYVAETENDVVQIWEANGAFSAAVTVGDQENSPDAPDAIAITPDSEIVLTANKIGDSVTLIDATPSSWPYYPTVIDTVSVGDAPEAIVAANISGVGMRAYTANANSDNVTVIEVDATPSVVTTVSVGDKPRGLAFYPNLASLLVANADGYSISKINTANNTATTFASSLSNKPFRLAVTSDGTKAYVSNPGPDKVSGFNATTGSLRGLISVGYTPGTVAVLED